ncbi:uncharacterized protein PHACADRAFT_207937 [Phanerochaete carnosa HHB-10118-sp]|uniref:Uncharacterized protein n=1 Tax=Phanerochaete carnosa (strain HHB-10118-sp) TaxID=650164 RepID=K5V2J1_PHACS|nr:uncharacterized protein PHACADRAFT_207937 [Phanerochaete carnosa HHB-10118-sp]EKM56746.1 hypothetical protein PHACADRAFT_207937 [Phanerochaete carnosa HHB-10118-sp]
MQTAASGVGGQVLGDGLTWLDSKAFTSNIAAESDPELTTAATGEHAEPLAKATSESSATSESTNSSVTESTASTPTAVSMNETATTSTTNTARGSTGFAAYLCLLHCFLAPLAHRYPLPDRPTSTASPPRSKRTECSGRHSCSTGARTRALADICAALRSGENPLKVGTIISYVVRALQEDGSLPYSPEDLKALARSEADSWRRHGWWILEQERRQWRGSGQRG